MEKFPLFDASVKVTLYQQGKKLMASGQEQLQKVQKNDKANVLYDDLTLMVPSFLQHFFIKQKQSESYMKLKEQVETDESTAVLQTDFAENYSTFWQDKVQSAQWHKNQIIVFTAAVWESVGCILAVVVSEDRSYLRDCVIVFLQGLIEKNSLGVGNVNMSTTRYVLGYYTFYRLLTFRSKLDIDLLFCF